MGETTSVSFTTPETGPNAPEEQNTPTPEGRPEWLPAEFNTVDDFVKGYNNTKAGFTQARQELASLKQEPTEEGEQDPPPRDPDAVQTDNLDQAAKDLAEKQGVDLSPYANEYAETGDVSEEHRAAIAEAFSDVLGPNARTIVDDYINAKKVAHSNDQRMYMEVAGGSEVYHEMSQWAAQNLSREEIEAYNRAVNSGDRHTTTFAIEGLKARYAAATGQAPRLISGQPAAPTSPFTSSAEMRRAMSDPRYKTDEAYRNQVRSRLAVSNL
jgi:hypothetical protein